MFKVYREQSVIILFYQKLRFYITIPLGFLIGLCCDLLQILGTLALKQLIGNRYEYDTTTISG